MSEQNYADCVACSRCGYPVPIPNSERYEKNCLTPEAMAVLAAAVAREDELRGMGVLRSGIYAEDRISQAVNAYLRLTNGNGNGAHE